ncbi:MAG: autotransporter-associated beta strand repeat-containing protein [Verrucomicrobiaceae bacterium]|nr:autotransporter-associated beta strand repeat-containing protein [Verrucomicrobiaceae bacterium]
MNILRKHRAALASLMLLATLFWSTFGYADTLYKTNSGSNTYLNVPYSTLGSPLPFNLTYGEGVAISAADILAFNNIVNVASTFRVGAAANDSISLNGISMGDADGAVTISNGFVTSGSDILGLTQTIKIGSGGIDLSKAVNNLTIGTEGTTAQGGVLTAASGSLGFSTLADQTWTIRNNRTLTFTNTPIALANNVTVSFVGGNTGGTVGNVAVNGNISGSGNLTLTGQNGGSGGVVTLYGDNSSWTGGASISGGSRLNLEYTGTQNKLNNSGTVAINRGTLNLQGTGSGTEIVGGLTLGQGLNQMSRSSGSVVLQVGPITSTAAGAGLNLGNIGTTASNSFLITSNPVTKGTLGSNLVAINALSGIDWVKTVVYTPPTGPNESRVVALSSGDYTTQNNLNNWTNPNQNILINGATTAGAAAPPTTTTIANLKVAHATLPGTQITANIGTGNTLMLNDGNNGGGIIRNQNGATVIGNLAGIGDSNLTAGGADDNTNDTLNLWNVQNTMTIHSLIVDNNLGGGTGALHLFTGGAGNVRLTADNTYSGGTTIAAGTLTLGANTLESDAANAGTGPITNFGTLLIDKTSTSVTALLNNISGTGSLTVSRGSVELDGTNTFTGDLNIGAGATVVAGTATALSSDSRVVMNAASGILDLAAMTVSPTIAALSGTQGTASVSIAAAQTLTLSGSDKARPGVNDSVLSATPQAYQGGITGAGGLVKNGVFNQQFSGAGVLSYTGATIINAGTIETTKAFATSGITVNGSGALISNVTNVVGGSVPVNLAGSASSWTIGAGFNQTVGSLVGVAGSRVITGAGANLTIGNNTGSAKTFSGVISGAGNVVISAASPVEFTGGNNYSGTTTVNQGILRVGATSQQEVLPDATAVTLANTAGVALDLNGRPETIGSLAGGGASGGNVTLGATGTLTMGGNNGTTTYGGVISGGTAGTTVITKTGNGTLTLSGTNTFAGNVIIRGTGGGLTLSGGTALADTVGVHNTGTGTTLTIIGNESLGPVTGGAGTTLALGASTLTSSYTNSAPANVAVSTADTDATVRVVKNINTAGLAPGQLITAASGITNAGSYIVQILNGDSILINQLPGAAATDIATVAVTTAGVLGSQVTGTTGGFVKTGPGLMILSGSNTFNGSITINDGTLRAGGGIWTGSKYAIQDTLGDGSPVIFPATGLQVLEFAVNATNLAPYERVPSISGGSTGGGTLAGTGPFTGSYINLSPTAGSTATAVALAVGNGNTDFTYNGNIGGLVGTLLVKEGSGLFTWNNGAGDSSISNFAGTLLIDAGKVTVGGATGMQSTSTLQMQNNSTIFTSTVTDGIGILSGGAGVTRPFANGQVGALAGNYISGVAPSLVINTGTTFTTNSTTNSAFNGVISGAGGFTKAGTSVFELRGAASYTGATTVSAGTLRLGSFGAATGLGAPGSGGFGSLATGTSLTLTASGATFDLNNATQSVTQIIGGTSGSTVAVGSGSLTFSAQTTQSSSTAFTSNANGVLNINGSGNLTLAVAQPGYSGRINIGTGQTLTLGAGGTNAARVNLATGATFALGASQSGTIGSLSGSGTLSVPTATFGLTVNQGGGLGSGAFSGAITGAGFLTVQDGSLKLAGNNTSTGGLNLTRGTLFLDYSTGATNIVPNTGALTLSGGMLLLKGNNTGDSAASTTLNAGASFIGAPAGDGSRLNLGAITRTVAGGTLQVMGNGTGSGAATSNAAGFIGGYATFGSSYLAESWAVSNGAAAAITALPLGSYVGTWSGTNHTDVNSSISATGTTQTVRFNANAANTITLTGNATVSSGGILLTENVGNNPSTITTGGAFTLAGNGTDLIVHQYNAYNSLLLDVVLASGGLTTAGPGTVILPRDQTATGAVAIGAGGKLQVGSGGTTGTLPTGAVTLLGVLDFNRSNAATVANSLTGGGWLIQEGAGALTLSGASASFSGRISVKNGSIIITRNTSVGSTLSGVAGISSVESGATYDLGNGTDISGSATIAEGIFLKGGTLRDNTTTAAQTAHTGVLGLLGATNTLASVTATDRFRIQSQILGMPDTSASAGAQPAGLVVGGAGITSIENVANQVFGTVTINNGATLSVGDAVAGSAGTLGGRMDIIDNGTLSYSSNDAHLVVGNAISGSGVLRVLRNNVYLTANNTVSGGTTVGSLTTGTVTDGVVLNIGNDTYTGSAGTGTLTLQAPTDASVNVRTHRNDDITISSLVLNPNNPSGTARNATFFRAGLGSVTLGNITVGQTATPGGTQRAIVQTDAGGKLNFSGTLTAGANNLMNIVNNNAVAFTGSASNTYDGVLSGNNVWAFGNTGTTTLTGVNTFNTTAYLQRGTLVMNNSLGTAMNDDVDVQVLRGTTLQANTFETIGALYTQKGGTVSVAAGQRLTMDDNTNQANWGTLTGAGDIKFDATGGAAWYTLLQNNNTFSGKPVIGSSSQISSVQVTSLTNAGLPSSLGTGSVIALGQPYSAQEARLEYIGAGSTTNRTIELGGGLVTSLAKTTGGATTSSTTLTLTDVTNVAVGMIISGTGITAGTKITAIDVPSKTLTLDTAATVAAAAAVNFFAATKTSGTAITNSTTIPIADTSGLATGMFVQGTGIQVGSKITSVGASSITIDNPATVAAAAALSFYSVFTPSATATTLRIEAGGTGPLVLNGPINAVSEGPKILVLHGQNADANTINGVINQTYLGSGSLSINVNPNVADDDRYGFGRWVLTNGGNNFSGNTTLTTGTLELKGDLKTGVETTSVFGDLSATRQISMGIAGFNGRRYDNQGGGDNLGAAANVGSMGTLVFNDPNPGTATLGPNITFFSASNSTTNPGRAQIVNDGTKVIVLQGNFTAANAGARAWTLDGTNTGINTISGIISDTANDGESVSIIKEGIGTWRLSGANTFEGGVTITRGVLQVAGGTALNDAATVTVSDAGADGLATINHGTFQVVTSETIGELAGNIGATTIIDAGQTLTLAGTSGTFSGVITGGGGITKTVTTINGATSAGTLTVPNLNTYTGPTQIGTHVVSAIPGASFTAGAASTVSVVYLANGGQPSGIGASSNAAANLILSNGANTSGGLNWTGFTNQSTDRLFTMGTGVGAATITANGTVVGTNAPALTFSNTGAIAFLATNQTGTLQLGGGTISDNTFSPQITNNGSSAISVSKIDAGMWLMTNSTSSYTGGTIINAGTLAVTAGGALGTGNVAIRGGAGNGLQLRGGVTLANNIDYSPFSTSTSDGGIGATGGGVNTISGTLAFNQTNGGTPGAAASAVLSNFRIGVDAGTTLDFTGKWTGAGISGTNGTGTITKFGPGTLTLSGANDYIAGNITVAGGTLKLNYAAQNNSKLVDSGTLTLGGAGAFTGLGVDDNVAGQSNVTGLSGGRVTLSGAANHAEIVGATTVGIGSNSVTRDAGSSALLHLNAISRSVGGTLDVGAAGFGITDTTNSTAGILGGWATVGKTDWAVTAGALSIGSVAWTTGTNTISTGALPNGTPIEFSGNIPNGLVGGKLYFIVNNTGATSQVSLTVGGTPETITASGSNGTIDRRAFITALPAAGYNNGLATDTYGLNFNTDVINFTTPTDVDVTPGVITNTMRFNQAGTHTLTLTDDLFLQTGGILVTPNSGNVTIAGATLQNNATGGGLEAVVIQQHSANGLQIDSVIQNNQTSFPLVNAQGITKSGTGKVILNAINTYTGTINLNEGELQVGGTLAAPGTPTNAMLGGGNNALNIAQGAQLTVNSSNPSALDLGTIQGGGNIVTTAANTQPLLLDGANGNWTGELTVGANTLLRVATDNNALGSNRGRTTLASGVVMQIEDARSLNELITFGTTNTVRILAALAQDTTNAVTLSGVLTFNNTSAAGLVFDTQIGALNTSSSLTLSGLLQGSNGFTKTGAGLLTISGNNFTDAIAGTTAINKTPSLFGQIRINEGELRIGNARALGATGVGNETVIASGASFDLRGNSLNFGDDDNPTREIISIAGTGLNGQGALRNSTGTANFSNLQLTGNATISGGGFANGSILSLTTYDTNTNNGSTLDGNFTRVRPTINGGGFDLTIFGGRMQDSVILQDPSFTSALNKIVIREGGLRIDKAVGPVSTFSGITAANVTNGIEIGYGGAGLADLLTPAAGVGPNVGARLNLLNNWDVHHTVAITMNGVLAAANNGVNYIDTSAATIPSSRTYLDGAITLSGAAMRNVFNIDSATSNNTVTEQGNLTASLQSKLIVGGAIGGSGGFTKTGFRELRLTNNNTFSGDLNVLRFGFTSVPWQTNTVNVNGVDYLTLGDAEGWSEYGLTLSGQNGAVSGTGNINLERRGMITLDNTTRLDLTSLVTGGNNNDRINDAANILLNHGWLRIIGGTVDNTESLATAFGAKVQVQSGTNILDLLPTEGAGASMTLTIGEISRSAGGVLRLVDLDSTSTFSTAGGADSVRVALGSIGTLAQTGAGTGATDKNVVIGLFGGIIPHTMGDDTRLLAFNNGNAADPLNQQRNLQFISGSHFMTYDGGFLRPLDDSEYFTPSDGLISTANGAAGQNVNLTDILSLENGSTLINALRFGPAADNNGSGGAINSGTKLTDYTQGHVVQLGIDGTLSIASGMISSAYFTVGNSADLRTITFGGSIDFGSSEAIINNQNGMVNLTNGAITNGNFEIRSNILGTGGLTKTGPSQVVLDGANTYTGVTTISDGAIFGRNGKSSFGASGAGNGIVVTGNGSLNTGSGMRVGSVAQPEDILVKALQGSQAVMGVNDDLTNWYGDLIIDNVDAARQVLFTPVVSFGTGATYLMNGDIYGGTSPVVSDINAIDSRLVQFNGGTNSTFIMRGQIGDRGVAGAPVPIADPISTLPTLAGTRTNENEVLRVNLTGNGETNFILDRQYNAAGRLTTIAGFMLVNYDPAAAGNDGTGFWTNTAISKIPNADSNNTTFALNGSTSQQGFALSGDVNSGVFLMRAGQSFNMSNWISASGGNGTKYIGGLNESGTVTYGNGFGSLAISGLAAQLYAAAGGTVVFDQRMTGSPGTAPNNVGIIKIGRGTVTLMNDGLAAASDANFFLAGGTLLLDHTTVNLARVGSQTTTFAGGTLYSLPHESFPSTANLATNNASSVIARFNTGGSEIVAEAANGRNMLISIGNNNANNNGANLTRQQGATVNFVEYQSGPSGVPQITLEFNAFTTAAMKNRVISWATYGTAPRTAVDFAMSDAAAIVGSVTANDVRAFGRPADEYVNDVSQWTTGIDVSEFGPGYFGTIGTSVAVNTLRFDTPGDGAVTIAAGQKLSLIGDQVTGGVLVDSNVGSSNKSITGGAIDAAVVQFTGDIKFLKNYTGTLASGSNTITAVSATDGLVVGMPITGTGIPANATITAINSGAGTITMSANATAGGSSVALTTDPADNLIYNVSSTANLTVGAPITGVGLAANTTITAINGSTLTISADATSTVAAGGIAAVTPEIVFHQYGTGKLIVNSNVGMAPLALTSGATTSGSANVSVASTAGLVPGLAVTGTGIPANTTIIKVVDATNLVLSANATATGTGLTLTGYSASDVAITGPSTTTPSTIGTSGAVVLANPQNGFTGRLMIGGAAVEFSDVGALGVNPASSVTNQITINGGTLRYTGTGYADLLNRGVRVEGNGAVIDVIDSNGELRISGDLNSAGTFRGDLVKVGTGTLTLGATNNANFGGLLDIRQGTLRLAEVGTAAPGTTTIMGSNISYADGTIFRTGADFAIQMGNGNNAGDFTMEEWITFEGTNYVTVGTISANANNVTNFANPGSARGINLQGVLSVNGPITIDTVNTQILRLNNAAGYMTGSGDITKDGQGTLEFRGNTPDWTGSLNIKQGTVLVANQADALGTGYLTNKTITLGSNERQGVASLLISNPDNIQNHVFEVNNPINVVYSRAQTKRIGIDNISNGDTVNFNGDITVNDNLILLMRDTTISAGGEQAYVNFNGKFKDGAVTGGNIVVQTDDSDTTANNLTNGRTYGYALLNADNSAWTGDLTISTNLTYNQDNTAIVRLNHATALTAANDVTMNFNSILQVGGGARAIGSLTTQGGTGPFFGDAGTMSASTNGSSEIIENAASAIGTLTINQTTPAAVENVWDAKFRDGTLNSAFLAPGANTSQPSAALNLVKAGGGWATLTLDNDYTGTTTVAAGILQVGKNNVGDTGAPNAAGLTVNAAATLAGTGIVNGNAVVQTGANLQPGDLAGALMGTLTFNGNATLQTGSITTLQAQRATYNHPGFTSGTGYMGWLGAIPGDSYSNVLSDPVLTTQHDMINVLGALTWSTGAKIVVTNNGYTPSVGDVFDLLDWFSVVGSINVGSQFRTGTETGTDLDLFELGGDYRWDTTLFNSNGILVVTIPGVIPEPGRAMLVFGGLLGLFFRRRRR